MNTFWLKVAGIVVVVVGLIILVSVFSSSESEPKAKPKTVHDMWQEDEKRLRAEPTAEPDVQAEQEHLTKKLPEPEKKVEPAKPQFTGLLPEQRAGADRLFEWALAQRKMARLPGMTITSYKKMVDACREIIQKFPGSEFDYKARRMLADIPQRHRKRYDITEEEIDLTGFFK
ncbi:MAG: hypothetical protein JSV82_04985 [Planctomycetota bacterium]|nr:MAG: hypothetical protein JSV82_04985 [Planctomycetota bacterium]